MKRFVFFVLVFSLSFCIIANADFGDRVLKKGMSGYDVNTLQRYLNELGYFDYEDGFTNYFGPITEEAVIKFQEEYDELEVDGVVGKGTFNYINAKIKQINLVKEKERKEKELAASVQNDLKELGLYKGEITSVIDTATIEALKTFQQDQGFEITGEPDEATQAKLNELFPKPVKEKSGITSRAVIDFTRKYLGKPYSYGAASGNAFDCSGFSTFVMKHFGIKLERRASQQAKKGTPIKREDLIVGDLVFFSQSGKSVDHVGIYIGDGNFIHASSYRRGVVIDNFNRYTGVYMGARRYLDIDDDD